VAPTKASAAKIRRFQEYSIEDRSFFARQSYDGEDQDLNVNLVEERDEGIEDEERETEGMYYLLVVQFPIIRSSLQFLPLFRWFGC
jgi:hypothetical protein